MSFAILVTTVLLLATTLVILRRIFHAHGTRQRTVLLANLRNSNQLGTSSLKEDSLQQPKRKTPIIAGFLHPYCNAGGGGERVLFAAISYLQRHDPQVLSVVYTGDVSPTTKLPVTKSEILHRCKERFGIVLDETKVEFVHLKWRWLVEDTTWKRFTLAGQGLGAALLAVEALWRVVPDVFLDTHGLAFSYPIARFLTHGITQQSTRPSMPIVAYIHYPTISSSMLSRIATRSTTYANSASISSSQWKSTAKLLYYRLFTFFYTSALSTIPPNFVAVNSSWTKGHVEALLATRRAEGALPGFVGALLDLAGMLAGWNVPTPKGINQPPKEGADIDTPSLTGSTGVRRIYPPCDVDPLCAFPLEGRKNVVFSCAQFRPEKDHIKKIQAFALLLKAHPELFVPEEMVDKTITNDNQMDAGDVVNSPAIIKDTGATEGDTGAKEPATVEQSGWLHVDSSRPPSPSKSSKTPESPTKSSEPSGPTHSVNLGDSVDKGDPGGSGGDKEPLKLVLLGSARHQEDLARVEELRALARELGIEPHVEFRLNAPYDELLNWLSVSSIGISTMVEEHFGIGVVEFMGAGLIPVVHASGGPIMDIVTPIDRKPTGFLATDGAWAARYVAKLLENLPSPLRLSVSYATTLLLRDLGYLATSAEEFAEQLYTALRMEEKDGLEMRARARESSARFSTVAFEHGFGALWEDVKKTL